MFEELGSGGGTKGGGNGELYEGVAGGRGNVEAVGDGGEVRGGEVEGVELVNCKS